MSFCAGTFPAIAKNWLALRLLRDGTGGTFRARSNPPSPLATTRAHRMEGGDEHAGVTSALSGMGLISQIAVSGKLPGLPATGMEQKSDASHNTSSSR
jgi:hypothetical protein